MVSVMPGEAGCSSGRMLLKRLCLLAVVVDRGCWLKGAENKRKAIDEVGKTRCKTRETAVSGYEQLRQRSAVEPGNGILISTLGEPAGHLRKSRWAYSLPDLYSLLNTHSALLEEATLAPEIVVNLAVIGEATRANYKTN